MMNSGSAQATVVIPTYNRCGILQRTLAALERQTVPSTLFEIVVVDDCSRDDTCEFMERYIQEHPNTRYIRHTENKCAAATRNDGARLALGSIIIFLDTDNVPESAFVEAHLACHAEWGATNIAVMGNPGYPQELIRKSNFARFQQSRYIGHRTRVGRGSIDFTNVPPRCFGTLNCSVRREDLFAVGLLDEDFSSYGGEDEILAFRLVQSGVRIVFSEGAVSTHYDEVSLDRFKSKLIEMGSASVKTMAAKHRPYLEGTLIKYLLPVERGDAWRRRLAKIGIRAVLNRPVVDLLERWCKISDAWPRAYVAIVFRMLLAGWLARGYASSERKRIVEYRPEGS